MVTDKFCPDWTSKVVSFTADGAAVNFGVHAGVIVKLRESAPQILGMHGCAHRLELAVQDACKSHKLVTDLDAVLEHVWKMYSFSPLCWQGLLEVGRQLHMKHLRKPVKLKGTRWVAQHERALRVVLNNWPSIIVDADQVRKGKTAMKGCAIKLYSLMSCYNIVLFANLFFDFLQVVSKLSCVLQSNC